MALAGASSVTCVDSSEYAVSQGKRNAELNKVSGTCGFLKKDVFHFLKEELNRSAHYDYISVDPPAFVKSGGKVREAAKAYIELNTLAMRLLKKGSFMAASSCSYHIDRGGFAEILREASKRAGVSFRIVEARSQAKDHPANLSVPETEYLKCFILEASGDPLPKTP